MVTRNRRGYSTVFWLGFLTFCLIPLVALAVNVGRFFYARAEMYKTADAAALAAVTEIDEKLFRETGQIVLDDGAMATAQAYANMNAGYLHSRKIYPAIISITVDNNKKAVYVEMAAATSELVPLLGTITLRGRGEAQVRQAAP